LVYFNTASGQTCDASDATKHFRGRGIFMVDVTTGELLAEKVFAASATSSNGSQIGYPALKYGFASAPAVIDIDHDGYADVIYIGDLGGQMWKWVIRAVGDDPINNSIANKSLGQPNWPFTMFFQAAFTDYRTPPQTPAVEALGSHYQSLFFPPAAVMAQSRLTLAFGAGERTNPTVRVNDDTTTDTTLANNNRFYVVKDLDPLLMQTPVTLTESNLINATNQGSAATCASTTSSGYYLIGDDGEKFITNSVVFLGTVITGSYLPPDPSATDPCTNSGTAFIYRFRLDCAVGQYSGSSTKEARRQATGTGLPTRPRVSVGSIENPNQTGANRAVVITSDGTIVNSVEAKPGKTVDLESWRER
jgi:type IV pilus assembly protein PilY1